ncbi:hypothetical protein NMG60_11031065 [Bertholletia excelsa]
MAKKSGTMDHWRNYFGTSNSDIFDIIEHAIMVAASDCSQEFRLRRDQIAETLFSCKLTRCLGCDRVELSVSDKVARQGESTGDDNDDEGCKSDFDRDEYDDFEGGGSKESKVNSSREEPVDMNMNQMSNYSYGDAEALTDEIEEQSQIVGEVLRVKEILGHSQDESDSMLFDSLRRLQLMDLSVDTLKATEIGKSVNALRKHGSKEIRHLARTLIEVWKDMVDEWVNTTAAIADAEDTPESVKPSILDEDEGLPSPPLDEGAFFATQPTSMELSQFFDGMDDDGNPQNSGEFNKNRDNGRKPKVENQTARRQEQEQQFIHEPYVPEYVPAYVPAKGKKVEEMKKQEPVKEKQPAATKPCKPSNTESGPGRPIKVNTDQKVSNATKFQQKSDKVTIQKKPLAVQQNKQKCLDEAARLEAAKRKLQERYEQAANAKRQRTIQVMELHDLPKRGLGHRNAYTKPGNAPMKAGNQSRHWANGRR